jgi:hypothetical protein
MNNVVQYRATTCSPQLREVHQAWQYSISTVAVQSNEWFETERCFIAIAFLLSFRMCHKEGLGRSDRLEINWYTSASVVL